MNWNINESLELLSQMPSNFSKHNLETIQSVIDNNKYIGSTMLNRDLCGQYAPFCAFCDKSINTPCAVAYIKMRQVEELEIAKENEYESIVNEALPDEVVELPKATSVEESRATDNTAAKLKKRIRIATAKRKK